MRALLNLTDEDYPDDVILSLIEVESNGDPEARRTTRVTVREGSSEEAAFREAVVGTVSRIPHEDDSEVMLLKGRVPSQFCGLLQMGRPAGIDVGFKRAGFRGWDTTADLMGNGRLAIQKMLEYQERYRSRHVGSPDRIAALWKGGPGTASTIAERLVAGDALDTAIGYAADEHGIPRLPEYVRRFRTARKAWRKWVAAQDAPPEVCEVNPSA